MALGGERRDADVEPLAEVIQDPDKCYRGEADENPTLEQFHAVIMRGYPTDHKGPDAGG
jgi:hypothetical protein